MRKSGCKAEVNGGGSGVTNNGGEAIDWELRPGGMLVQKREDESGPARPMIKVKVSHGTYHHEIPVPAQSTFGELKKILARETGLEPQEQRLLFRGKEKDNEEYLHMVGVKDMSKVVLMEDPASKERKLEQMQSDHRIALACEAIGRVGTEVDKLSDRVYALEAAVHEGTKLAGKEFDILTELLMTQLLKLDSIEADGEAKVQRKSEVCRIQKVVDTLDVLKARNSSPFSSNNSSSDVSVTTKWETFESGMGSLNAPPPVRSSTKITDDWEQFD